VAQWYGTIITQWPGVLLQQPALLGITDCFRLYVVKHITMLFLVLPPQGGQVYGTVLQGTADTLQCHS
jgi:hypothetical protein